MTPEELKRLDELENAATPSPWGWKPTGEKSNDAVLATFYSNDGTPIGGRVETERFHEETEKWETLATDDEVIFYKENDANYTDFDFVCAIRNSIRPLLAHIATLEGFRREALAARNILDWRGKNIVSFNPEVAQAEHLIYHAARAANTTERTTP